MDSPEDRLLDFVTSYRSAAVPVATREKAGLCLLDAVSLAVAAREHPVVVAAAALSGTASDGAELWASGHPTTAPGAAFGNAVAAHAHFHDDTDMVAWAHPGSLITPGPVALVRSRRLPPEAALRAIAVGYACLTWLGAEEAVARAIVDRGFRAGPVLGAVAAATASASALDLDREGVSCALGIAADSAGALLEPVRAGAQDWRLQNANAARAGVEAALLAEAGVTGPPQPLSGPRGFAAAFTGSDAVPDRWATPPDLADLERVWFKKFPTLGDNMAVAVAAQQVHRTGIDPHTIERVVVGMNPHFASYPGTAYRGPFRTIDQATASTAFAVSALLVHGDLRYADYPDLLRDPTVLTLVERVRIEPEPSFDYVSGRVTTEGPGGSVTRHASDAPRTAFFRDRSAARHAALRAVGPAARDAVDGWFAWLDGRRSPDPLGALLAGLRAGLLSPSGSRTAG